MTLIIEISCRGISGTRRLELEAGQEIVVGRDNTDLLLTKDQTLSRQHFRLSYFENSITVEHLSRTNPTLVASEGSSDFKKVVDSTCELRACRIIAGSHRFVAAVETPDSATISGHSHEIWSDVDESSVSAIAFGNEITASQPDGVTRQNDEMQRSKKPLREPVPTEEKPVFSWDDSVRENIEPPAIAEPRTRPHEIAESAEAPPNRPGKMPREEHAKPQPKQPDNVEPSPKESGSDREEQIQEKQSLPKTNFIPQDDDFFD
jgi:hypothetical protein